MTIRLGMIGCGNIARGLSLFAAHNPHIEIAAACDVNQAAAEALASEYGIPHVYTDYRDMLANTSLDAVYIAVPHNLHLEITRDVVAAGVHILLEKPLAHTLGDARQLVALDGVRIGVNYQNRYDSGNYALAQAARSGALGTLNYGRCNIPWLRDNDYFEEGAWRGQKHRSGGGTLITQGSHSLDILLWAFNSRPVAAYGMTARRKFDHIDVEDLAMGVVELESGALIEITSAMIANPQRPVSIEVYGSNATAHYNEETETRVDFLGKTITPAPMTITGVHPLQRSLEAFRLWIEGEHDYLIPAEEALPVMAAVDAIYRSAQSGIRETIVF
jgi:UDP-N-acetyl-2-amino-2-deoxyglucuronate dehydrogenase